MKNGLCFLFVVAASGHAQNRRAEEMRRPVCTSALQLPQGFCATVFAEGLSGARHIVVASNGDVFVNTERGRGGAGRGAVVALRDTNGDGKADVQKRFGDGGGTGIALDGNQLYATSGSSIVRYRLAPGWVTTVGTVETI